MKPDLHVIGCGRAARVIVRRLHEADVVRVGRVINRSVESARAAVAFIGAGQAGDSLASMRAGCPQSQASHWLLLGVPEGALAAMVASLADGERHRPALSFHLSGSMNSEVLKPLGSPAASVHPVRAFADPAHALAEFSGTWCTVEGDEAAVAMLEPAFQAIGARTLRMDRGDKRRYHAATVAASNYLVTVHALACELAAGAGLQADQAQEMLCDLQSGTLENIRTLGAVEALTGPIERGDVDACRALLAAVPTTQRPLFAALGLATVALARKRHPERDWDELQTLFDRRAR